MKNFLRKKLGLPIVDETLVTKVEDKIQSLAPISLDQEQSEVRNTDQSFKTINVGNIKNPVYKIVAGIEGTDSYYSIQDPNIKYYFGRSSYDYTFNGETYIYNPGFRPLDPENPFDPIFSSFNRLTSYPPRLIQSGKLTGIRSANDLYSCSLTGPVGFPAICKKRPAIYVTTTKNGGDPNNSWSTYSGNGIANSYFYGKLTQFNLSSDQYITSGSNRKYTFGNYIDSYYWGTDANDQLDFILFDKSGELGYGTGKWLGLSTSLYDTPLGFREITDMGYLNAYDISYRNERTPHLNKLVTLVCTLPSQNENFLPTISWSGIARAQYVDSWESYRTASGIKVEVNTLKEKLLVETTGFIYSQTQMGGKERYLNLNNNSFTSGYGFYKIATTRESYDANHIYARLTGVTLQVGNTSGITPSGYFKVTYPHSYFTKTFGALMHDAIIVPELTDNQNSTVISGKIYASGIQDIIVISTGINEKKIVYVSPNTIIGFTGFWSEKFVSNRTPIKKVKTVSGAQVTGFTDRAVYNLKSGTLISITSKNSLLPIKQDFAVSISGNFVNYSNVPESMLKNTGNMTNNLYYKLYEPIYKPNAFNQSWNGIIPSGTPFQIEIIRTNSNVYGSNLRLGIYANNYFSNNVSEYSGQLVREYGVSGVQYGLFGVFEGNATIISRNSLKEASYYAENKAYKLLSSRINGALWDKGVSKQNSRANKIIKLFNGGSFPFKTYSYMKNNVKQYAIGIKTSAGIRNQYGDLIKIDSESAAEGEIWTEEV